MTESLKSAPPAISKAITEAMKEVHKIRKTEKNKFANYEYASIDDFLEDLRPKLSEAGLNVVSNEISREHINVPEKQKDGSFKDSLFAYYIYEFYLLHEGADQSYGPLMRSVDVRFVGPQTSGQAQSYAEKMFLRSLLKVATGDQDADSQEQGNFQKAKQAQNKPDDEEIKNTCAKIKQLMNEAKSANQLKATWADSQNFLNNLKKQKPDWYEILETQYTSKLNEFNTKQEAEE